MLIKKYCYCILIYELIKLTRKKFAFKIRSILIFFFKFCKFYDKEKDKLSLN